MIFSDIPGHAVLKERLIEMANGGRVGHTLLFWGDEGMGALPLALALAQQMACTNKEGGLACGKCSTCNKMQKLIHPDLHFAVPVNSVKPSDRNPVTDFYIKIWREAVLENPYMSEFQWYEKLGMDNKSGNISVHEADSILKKLRFKAYEGNAKFMIIWLPERMNIQAANTLLKILEEPSQGTYFFLVSEHPEQLIPTIRSRCQLIRVNPVATHLSIQGAHQNELAIYAMDLMKWCNEKKLLPVTQWCEEVAGFGRERQRQMILRLLDAIRKIYLEQIGTMTDARRDAINRVSTLSWNFPDIVQALNGALADMDRNVNPKMIFYGVGLRLFFA